MGFLDLFKRKQLESASSQASSTTGTERYDLREAIVDPLVIAPASIIGGTLQEIANLRVNENRYLLADRLYWDDERLFSAVSLIALMVQKSVGDPSIQNQDKTLTNEEENAVEEATNWYKAMDIPALYHDYTVDLWKYGDAVDVIKFNGSQGITGLEPLPMHSITAVETRDQIGSSPSISFKDRAQLISKPQFYVIDENYSINDLATRVIRKDRILHISFHNRRSMIRDNLKRWTLNTWSMAPINSLFGIIAWKQHLIRNDMLWRNRALPREWHKLNLNMFDPSRYKGTYSEKLTAAKADAKQAIEDYNETNAKREADQGFTTGSNVEITWIEPKTSTYADPLPIIDQINSLLGGPSGTPSALMGGESKGFTSLVHASSFLALRAEIYASVIQKKLEELMKRHIRIVRPGIDDAVVNRLFIKNRLILDRDRTELAKIISVLVGAKVFTPSEIRAIWGLDPLTEHQFEELIDWLDNTQSKGFGNSPRSVSDDLLGRDQASPTGGMQTQGKREREINSRGDRIKGQLL